jgi:hypothetical protein
MALRSAQTSAWLRAFGAEILDLTRDSVGDVCLAALKSLD